MITSDGRGILNDWDMAGPDAGAIYVVSSNLRSQIKIVLTLRRAHGTICP